MQSLFERFGASLAVAFGLGLLFALVILPITTNAQTAPDTELSTTEETTQRARELAEERRTQTADEKREAAQLKAIQKQQEARLKACQKREQKVQDIMSRIADRGQRHVDVFTKISDRTQAFYEEKGYNLANYDELVENVNQARTVAELHANRQSELGVTFTCDSENPKAATTAFKQQLKEQIAALKDYRTAVKDLIVGVKSAHEAAEVETTENDAETETDEGTNE